MFACDNTSRLGTVWKFYPGTLSRRTPPYIITFATSLHYVVIIPICRTRPDTVADVHLLCVNVAPIVRRRHTHCLRASCAGDNHNFCDSYDPARASGARAHTCRARACSRRVASVRKRVLVFCPEPPRSNDRNRSRRMYSIMHSG